MKKYLYSFEVSLRRTSLLAPRSSSRVLNTIYSILNLIDYLHIRVPEVGLETSIVYNNLSVYNQTFMKICHAEFLKHN
jgi:hypothetical protein